MLIVLLCCATAQAQVFDSLTLINSANWARFFNDVMGYQYASRGNLHFYPSDIYLLYRTIAPGTALKVKPYKLAAGDPSFQTSRIPYFTDITKSEDDIQKHLGVFKSAYTELVLYPSLNLLFLFSGGGPYAKIAVQCGLVNPYLAPLEVAADQPIKWDSLPSRPTETGSFELYSITSHYLSGTYYKDTVVPFGAWLRKIKGVWCYQENDWWYRLPDYIASDLEKEPGKRQFKYYDVDMSVPAARWAGNDFGSYVMLWTNKKGYRTDQIGYAPEELCYEQVILVKDIVQLLTLDGPAELDYFVGKNRNFSFYKSLYDFIGSQGKTPPPGVARQLLDDYRLMKGWELQGEIDPRLLKAFKEYTENRLPRDREARQRALGLYNYLQQNAWLIEKQARWYERLKGNWGFLMEVKKKLAEDFIRMGVLSQENRQNILEGWLTERLAFGKAAPPSEAKYLQELAFTTFFRPDEKSSVFTQRESAVMRDTIRKILSGEVTGLELDSVNALNNYNFGRLLNEILGDLYKSHGCLHVSPRNSYFLYNILPVGARMNVHKYSENISSEALSGIPLLSDMVNLSEELEQLKNQIAVTEEVRIEVFPSTGDWILYLKDQPFTRIVVRGGPRAPFYMLQGRDASGKPIFEDHLAYPTTTGKYYIFHKVVDYLSNLYRDTTIIPMGGTIRLIDKGWVFNDRGGNLRSLPEVVADDLNRPPEARQYTYYDSVSNASDEVVAVKWGSHPFGKYAIETSIDKKKSFPELIHSSGDLIMEERQIVNDLIGLLALPYDNLEDCVDYDPNFAYYKICSDFVADPSSGEAIGVKERANYKLYFGLSLSSEEAAALPPDLFIVSKIVRGQKPDNTENLLLIAQGLAKKVKGKLVIDRQKINGMNFDMYQYVVAIQKYANHYNVLKKHWSELNELRLAMLKDFNNFVIKDSALFHNFMRELMLSRTRLEKITQEKAFKLLDQLVNQANP